MSPQIHHNMIAPGAGTKEEVKELSVYSVMSPEDEKLMKEYESSLASEIAEMQNKKLYEDQVKKTLEDPVLEQELERKRTFEQLILFKKPKTTTVSIHGANFTLKLLNSNESNQVYKEVIALPKEEQLVKTPLMVLAAALVSVNSVPLEEAYSGPKDIESVLLRKYYEVSQWHSPLVNALSTAYNSFTKDVESEYTKDFLASKS